MAITTLTNPANSETLRTAWQAAISSSRPNRSCGERFGKIYEPMYRLQPLVVLVISECLFLSACVEKKEYDALQKKLDDTAKELSETKVSLKKSQDQLADLQAHRYQALTHAGRTWRLDTSSGSACILLTSEQDWKNSNTKVQSCVCEDFYRDQEKKVLPAELSASEVEKRFELYAKRAKRLGCE